MFTKDADPKLVELVVRNVSRANPDIAISTIENYFDTPVIPLLADVHVPFVVPERRPVAELSGDKQQVP